MIKTETTYNVGTIINPHGYVMIDKIHEENGTSHFRATTLKTAWSKRQHKTYIKNCNEDCSEIANVTKITAAVVSLLVALLSNAGISDPEFCVK
ncbi:hypothetical protein DPMN_007984 [Dreissena polymorpha]|uniref:Uncharacterized protein n=1 Tax=Dreissena polymorpha TaxID=45954 RepID=A0A9D4MYC3_DREPO|nr:hypothetical protein DPMN_007984 [Dreissena polymorpha]